MGRKTTEIRATLVLPNNLNALRQFEQRMGDFYASQVEKRLQGLPKNQKIEVLDSLLATYSKHAI